MATTEGYILPAVAAGDELEVVSLTETDRRAEHDTYTPTLTATGGTPAVGASGFITGWWYRTGRLVTVWVDISLAGAGVSLVGTSWRVSLPHNADTSRHTAGILNAESDCLGIMRTYSGTSAQGNTYSALLSAVKELIFYGPGTTTSMGSADFTTAGRIKICVQYLADAAAF